MEKVMSMIVKSVTFVVLAVSCLIGILLDVIIFIPTCIWLKTSDVGFSCKEIFRLYWYEGVYKEIKRQFTKLKELA